MFHHPFECPQVQGAFDNKDEGKFQDSLTELATETGMEGILIFSESDWLDMNDEEKEAEIAKTLQPGEEGNNDFEYLAIAIKCGEEGDGDCGGIFVPLEYYTDLDPKKSDTHETFHDALDGSLVSEGETRGEDLHQSMKRAGLKTAEEVKKMKESRVSLIMQIQVTKIICYVVFIDDVFVWMFRIANEN